MDIIYLSHGTRPWFSRLWILLEVGLSIDKWLVCGSDSLS